MGQCCQPVGQRCYEVAATSAMKTADTSVVTANPLNWTFSGTIATIRNGTCANGNEFWRINTGGSNANTQITLELGYLPPTGTISQVGMCHGGGSILNDCDGVGAANATLLDADGNIIAGPFPMTLANNGAFQVTNIPGGPVTGVATLRISDITPCAGGAPNTHIREIALMGPLLAPAYGTYCCTEDPPVSWRDARNNALLIDPVLRDCRE